MGRRPGIGESIIKREQGSPGKKETGPFVCLKTGQDRVLANIRKNPV
jgi:hypothetical protein